jgi:hypothetical protein
MLRQLILIFALGGFPLLSAAATEAVDANAVSACTQTQPPQHAAAANQPQGPVWVVQNPAPLTPASLQGPVWVVQRERPVKPLS